MTLNGCSKKLCPMQVGAADNCELTKEQCPYFTQDIDYQKVLNEIKAMVAREILSDIKKQVHNKMVHAVSQDEYSYINIKVFDAIIANYLNDLK